MNLENRWQNQTPIDWIEIWIRIVWAVALPLVAGMSGVLDTPTGMLILIWQALVAVTYVFGLPSSRPTPFNAILLMFEVLFAVLLIRQTGGLMSPLWWTLLIGGVSASFSIEFWVLPFVIAFAALTAGLDGWIQRGSQLLELNLVGFYVLVIALTSWGMYVLSRQLRKRADGLHKRFETEMRVALSEEWIKVEAALEGSTAILSDLNLQRVYKKTLKTTTQNLLSGEQDDPRLQAGLFSFEPDSLILVAGEGIALRGEGNAVELDGGQMENALGKDEILRVEGGARDPEISQLEFSERIGEVLCVPLLTDHEPQGLLLCAHPRLAFFHEEQVQRLEMMRKQISIAMRNARLYRQIQDELERITEIQEEARKKLARDLHDGPTQTIAAIAMRLNFARRLMNRDLAKAADEMRKVEDIARSTTREIRHMLFTLRPLILESQGLEAALSELAYKLGETHGQKVLIESDADTSDELGMSVQAVLFFIAEEAINNACKHAEAEHIWVRLHQQDDGQFILEIQDDGVGFNVGSVDSDYERRGSLGMVNMRERTELIKGLLHIESAEGEGTTIKVTVPLDVAQLELASEEQPTTG